MTKAPERIWVIDNPYTPSEVVDYPIPNHPEYIRSDHALALAQAALVARDARIKQEARNEALREVINLVNGCDRVSEVQPAIENLITED